MRKIIKQLQNGKLTHKDRRFAFNLENVFFKTIKIMLVKVISSIWVHLRKGKVGALALTASAVASDTKIKNILLQGWLQGFPGTENLSRLQREA